MKILSQGGEITRTYMNRGPSEYREVELLYILLFQQMHSIVKS
jgi:hypothetical protein